MPDGGGLKGYDIEVQVGFMLRRAHQRHAALFLEGMQGIELTPTQFNALVRVIELGSVTQNQLGRLTAMDPATVQGVVRRLVERGLVARAADPRDRRAMVLTATEGGVVMGRAAVERGREVTAATLAPLSEGERRRFLELLGRMV